MGLLPAEADAHLQECGLNRWRGRQLRQWVYGKMVANPAEMTSFSKEHRQRLQNVFAFTPAHMIRRQDSSDGTIKLLLEWEPGQVAETVMIPDGPRRTACVSSQVGCPVGCRFCASGMGGAKGNLSAAQIVEQVVQLNMVMGGDQRITNVVFMGMGEPMANYANVLQAIRVLHDPECLESRRQANYGLNRRRARPRSASSPRKTCR